MLLQVSFHQHLSRLNAFPLKRECPWSVTYLSVLCRASPGPLFPLFPSTPPPPRYLISSQGLGHLFNPMPTFDSAPLASHLPVSWYHNLTPQTKCIHFSPIPCTPSSRLPRPTGASLLTPFFHSLPVIVTTPVALTPRQALEVPYTWRLSTTYDVASCPQ